MKRALSFAAVGLAVLAQGARAEEPPILHVMTQNQYLGGDLGVVLAPPEQLNDALFGLLKQIAASDVEGRLREQAKEILRRRPDLVGLQEVQMNVCIDDPAAPPPEPGQGCDHPDIRGAFVDFLQVTLDGLRNRYEAVAVVENFSTRGLEVNIEGGGTLTLPGVPFVIDGVRVFLAATDRDVILARSKTVDDLAIVDFAGLTGCDESADGCNYTAAPTITIGLPGGSAEVAFERGFVGVDATVRGRAYRFVTTHFEIRQPEPGNPVSRFFQAAQATQLLGILGATTTPDRTLVVVGDINSSPEDLPVPGPLPLPEPFADGITPPYQQFVAAGLIDVWEEQWLTPDAGFTCCQDPDLRNEVSAFDERIDVIFTSEPPLAALARVVGDRIGDKTPRTRLWPSDHGGLVARLIFWPEELAAHLN